MSDRPSRPETALDPDDLQRFMYACSHERRSPTTHRMIDAASYGWIHQFIRSQGEGEVAASDPRWLDPHDADPQKLSDYFGRVAIRLRSTGAYNYAVSLQDHFREVARAFQ